MVWKSNQIPQFTDFLSIYPSRGHKRKLDEDDAASESSKESSNEDEEGSSSEADEMAAALEAELNDFMWHSCRRWSLYLYFTYHKQIRLQMSPLCQYSMFFQNMCVYFAKQHESWHIILQNQK